MSVANQINNLLRHRYKKVVIAAVISVFSLALIAWQLDIIPPGFSVAEKQAMITSINLDVDKKMFIDLPFHGLQKASLWLFGLSPWGARLPSVLFGLMTVAAVYFLLRRWFQRYTAATLGAVLTVASTLFLLYTRQGSPEVMYFFWPVMLLLTASYTNTEDDSWRPWFFAFTLVAGLSLYTPYMAFFVIIFMLLAAASRSGRALIMGQVDGPAIALSALTLLVLLVPMGYSISQNPESGLAYLGAVQTPTLEFLQTRATEIGTYLIGIGDAKNTFTPVLSLPAVAFALYGLYYCVRQIGHTRYATILLWFLIALALFLSAQTVPLTILFLPIILLVTIGFYQFTKIWYGLFPRNPYARVAVLLPIGVLLFAMVQFNYQRYFYGLPRSADAHQKYDSDIVLLQNQLGKEPIISRLTVVVPQSETKFYSLVEKKYNSVKVTTANSGEVSYRSSQLIIAQSEYEKLSESAQQSLGQREVKLIVDDHGGDEALRFRSYQ